MIRKLLFVAAAFAVAGMILSGGSVAVGASQQHGKPGQDKPGHGNQDKEKGNPDKGKPHKNVNGKNMVGDKLKQNGRHKLEQHGKVASEIDVQNGKITGFKAKHADKGDVPVTKFKSDKKMAFGPQRQGDVQFASNGPQRQGGVQFASNAYADVFITISIGYGYYDDYGEMYITWFPVEWIYDGDYGAEE